jgi:IS30 family transposase
VSHETIYQAVYFQARGGMRQELARQVALRSTRTGRRPQSRAASAGWGARAWVRPFHISARRLRWRIGRCPGTGKAT